MNSNVAITRCVVAELNPDKRSVNRVSAGITLMLYSHRTRALLLLPLFANAGQLFGPLVGGLLSSKTGNGPLKAYPYAPPNMFTAAIFAIAAIGVIFGVEETLESLQHTEGSFARRMWKKIVNYTSRGDSRDYAYAAINSEEPNTPTSPLVEFTPGGRPASSSSKPPKRKAKLPFRRIWTFNVLCTLLSHFIIAGHLGTFSNLWAIFLSTPVEQPDKQHPPIHFGGGIGMQPRDVGFAMSIIGAIGVFLQMAVYPMLNDRFGAVRVWQVALFIFPLVYIFAPFPSLVASANYPNGENALVWLAVCIVLLLFIVGRTGVTPATTLLINDCTPHPSVRGTVHTAGTVVGNLSRSIFPVAAFTIFGNGLQIGVVGLGFWCLAGLAVLSCVASRWVREGSNGQEILLEGDEEEAQSSGIDAGSQPTRRN